MIRLFKVYYPLRALVLLVGEALIVWMSFATGVWTASLMSESGFPNPAPLPMYGIRSLNFWLVGVTAVVLLFSHWLDLYDTSNLAATWDQTFRLLLVLGLVALVLSVIGYRLPSFLPGNDSLLIGLVILTVALFVWRAAYTRIVQHPYFRENVYILGTGDRAQRLLNGLRQRTHLGIEVAGWTGSIEGELTRETVAQDVVDAVHKRAVHRVIVAMADRRGMFPVEELLALRLAGVKVEEATSWLERISGRIEVDQLYPSWLIFADGFRFSRFYHTLRQAVNFGVALIGLVLFLPLFPFVVLAVRLSSPGPIFYQQKRVGLGGETFYCYKFRTMREDAEADTGATWAADDDPRITPVGRFLRLSRLDEIPQLWCVLKGAMNFVGPRPERPEFVEWLSKEIPYYGVRHTVRPGITGWAQVQYKYGNTLEDAREKLQYDLFYIKNASIGLDLLIMFQTIKIVLLGRGAR